MARCLRCRAGNEWIEGGGTATARIEELERENAHLLKALRKADEGASAALEELTRQSAQLGAADRLVEVLHSKGFSGWSKRLNDALEAYRKAKEGA